MKRTPEDERSNPISRAFSKFAERGRVGRSDPSSGPAHRAAPDGPEAENPPPRRAASGATPAAGTGRTARGSAAPSAPSAASITPTATASPRTYTVVKGDSLSTIAQRVYGRADRWTLIFDANRNTISDPDLIHPGQVLVLPEVPSLH